MIRDLRTILEGWEYEPGRISVRKIIGRGGREKIQTRIDLGVLQIEPDGHPNGEHPRDHDSYLAFQEARLARHVELHGSDEDFVLTPDDCHDLRHEASLYYQRYLSLFVLEDFERVVRDTARNLRAIEVCEQYAACGEDRRALSPQRPYVMMMNVRARACLALQSGDCDGALRAVEGGLAELRKLRAAGCEDDAASCADEDRILRALRTEILAKMPANARARLEDELRAALEAEDFERAAVLRDKLAERPPEADG